MVITIYGNEKRSHDSIDHISELSSKRQSEWYITSYTSIRFSNLMVITIYGNSVKSHDHMNDISELSSKNWSEWYITSYISIRFSKFDGNYHIWQ
jgi:hypothetical protein